MGIFLTLSKPNNYNVLMLHSLKKSILVSIINMNCNHGYSICDGIIMHFSDKSNVGNIQYNLSSFVSNILFYHLCLLKLSA